MKKLGQIDFGPTDARHIIFSSANDQRDFEKMFITPAQVNVSHFLDGRKSIVYGIKGSGKSAFLKYLDITQNTKAETKFFYFRKQSDHFFDNLEVGEEAGEEVRNFEKIPRTEFQRFWDTFILLAIANQLSRREDPESLSFVANVRGLIKRNETWITGLMNQVPIIEKFAARIGFKTEIEIEGKFKHIDMKALEVDSMFSILERSINRKPIYLFFDEMEISFSSESKFQGEVGLISKLIEAIRDFNEILRRRNIPIFIIAAIRKEVSHRILGGDISKIVNDLGQEISWQRRSWSKSERGFIHPLFEIIIRRIAFSEDRKREALTEHSAHAIIKERFPSHIHSGNIQKDILDMTMYRPRDCAMLMNIAGSIDSEKYRFRAETFRVDIKKQFGERVWVDIKEALNSKYLEEEINAIKGVLTGLDREFTVEEFFQNLDDYAYDPVIAKILDKGSDFWIGILKDLFELGALGNISKDGKYRFRFRGQSSLLIKRGEKIIVHQSLTSEFV